LSAALFCRDSRGTFDGVTLRLSTSNLEAIERLGVGVPHDDRRALAPRILGTGGAIAASAKR
jgi:hypothetical protein